MTVILASGSATRRALLSQAGVDFEVKMSGLDERALERPLLSVGAAPDDIAIALAKAKAAIVSGGSPSDLVIGADQTLDLDGERLTKPDDMEEARAQLMRLSGRTHRLHSAVVAARNGAVIWQNLESAELTMRQLAPAVIAAYLSRLGPAALTSVGAYHLEGLGIQLFEDIRGDYFAILGLPLLPLLAFLRDQRVLE